MPCLVKRDGQDFIFSRFLKFGYFYFDFIEEIKILNFLGSELY